MALKAYMGNRPLFDDDGFVHGAVKNVELITHKEKDGGEWESLRWTFEVPGTLRPFEFNELSGLAIHAPDDKGNVNKLTDLVLRLGVLTLEDVQKDELPEHDLEACIGQCVQFKIYRKDAFYRIDLTTLALDQEAKPKGKK